MQVTLFRTLQSIKVDDEAAAKVVDELETQIAMKIEDATRRFEAKLDSTQRSVESYHRVVLLGMSLIGLLIAGATYFIKFAS